MFIDHTAVIFEPMLLGGPSTSTWYYVLRSLGRVAFSIYVFFIAEGCRRTSNIGKYVARLALFAVVSELPFDLALFIQNRNLGLSDFMLFNEHQNVFLTLALGACCIWAFQFMTKGIMKYARFIPCLACIALGDLLRTDYGSMGVLFIFLLYMAPELRMSVTKHKSRPPQYMPSGLDDNGFQVGAARSDNTLKSNSVAFTRGDRIWQIILLFLMEFYFNIISWIRWESIPLMAEYGIIDVVLPRYAIMLMSGACLSYVMLAFYNGRKGKGSTFLKWFFYIAYPGHLIILFVIKYLYVWPNS
jgi:hypothetical protein